MVKKIKKILFDTTYLELPNSGAFIDVVNVPLTPELPNSLIPPVRHVCLESLLAMLAVGRCIHSKSDTYRVSDNVG